MLILSQDFWHGREILDRPVFALVGLMSFSGLVYLIATVLVRRSFEPGRWWWFGMLGVGVAMRALMVPSVPMLDDDYYRYLWDGGQVARGQSPYEIAPIAIAVATGAEESALAVTASQVVTTRVNHPSLRSIYPPVAQLGFAMAHFIAPWNVLGLKAVWFVADVATLGLLAALLRSVGMPLRHLLVYWWNPLLVKETYNSAHMDILVLPFVVGGLLLAIGHRQALATIAIALGVGVKLWPIIVLPAALRYRGFGARSSVTALMLFAVTSGAVTAPLLLGATNSSSGLLAYASRWEMNDSLYLWLYSLGSWVAPLAPHAVARALVAAILVGTAIWMCRTPAIDGRQLCTRVLCLVSALFLLSPTQFPWYWIWLLPMLTVVPVNALILLSATLPLYYLRFTMDALGYATLFDYGVVWVEFGPTLVLLTWSAIQKARTNMRFGAQLDLAHER